MTISVPNNETDLQDKFQPSGSRYLIFSVGGQLYGTLLKHVREIIAPMPTKPILSTAPHFLGVVNLRGKIIGILDLRILFSAEPLITEKLAFVIFDTDHGPLGAVVDFVDSVATIANEYIEPNPTIATRIPLSYLAGIARFGEKLISIINLKRILSEEELTRLEDSAPLPRTSEQNAS